MLSTTHNFSNQYPGTRLFIVQLWLIVELAICLSGCTAAKKTEQFFTLTNENLQQRSLQSRMFETTDEHELLSASAAVLQDLGFQVEEVSAETGLLKAAKERSARELKQELIQGLLFVLGLVAEDIVIFPIDLHQQINVVLVTRPGVFHSSRYTVRVQFYRTVWKGDGYYFGTSLPGAEVIKPGKRVTELIHDKAIYQAFFAHLSKSIFLEAHEI